MKKMNVCGFRIESQKGSWAVFASHMILLHVIGFANTMQGSSDSMVKLYNGQKDNVKRTVLTVVVTLRQAIFCMSHQ
jgi:hypothetical protein